MGRERSALKLPRSGNKNKSNIRLYMVLIFSRQKAVLSIKHNYSKKQANRNYGAIAKRTPTDCVVNVE